MKLLSSLIALILVIPVLTPALALAPTQVKPLPVEEKCSDSDIRCNCYLFVKSLVPGLPLSAALKPNSPAKVGSVALFNYHGLKHYAYVSKLGGYTFTVKECNFKHGECGTREVSYDDPFLVGFWL